MPQNGILSLKTFFPKNGDVFDDLEDGVSWLCARAHLYLDPKTGRKIRYALLVGRHPDFGDTPIPKVVDDAEVPLPFLATVDKVHRHRTRDEKTTTYKKNAKGNYEDT